MPKLGELVLRKKLAEIKGQVMLKSRRQGLCTISVSFSEPYDVSSIYTKTQLEVKAFQTMGVFTFMGKDKKDLLVEIWEADRPAYGGGYRREKIAILKGIKEEARPAEAKPAEVVQKAGA